MASLALRAADDLDNTVVRLEALIQDIQRLQNEIRADAKFIRDEHRQRLADTAADAS